MTLTTDPRDVLRAPSSPPLTIPLRQLRRVMRMMTADEAVAMAREDKSRRYVVGPKLAYSVSMVTVAKLQERPWSRASKNSVRLQMIRQVRAAWLTMPRSQRDIAMRTLRAWPTPYPER